MAETEKSAAKKQKPPRGGRRGGTRYPKVKLAQAVAYAKKLVSKTHTGPQPEETILPGVFGNAGPIGQVRASALKQYGLLEGPANAYKATQLAKDIEAAPDDTARAPLLQQAFLKPKLFAQIFETFHGDSVSKPKIEQRAKGLEVHPENADECAQIFIDSAVTSGLGTAAGDSITLIKSGAQATAATTGDEVVNEFDSEVNSGGDSEDLDRGEEELETPTPKDVSEGEHSSKLKPKAQVNLTLTVDASSDPDKLAKQLKLLRQYGML